MRTPHPTYAALALVALTSCLPEPAPPMRERPGTGEPDTGSLEPDLGAPEDAGAPDTGNTDEDMGGTEPTSGFTSREPVLTGIPSRGIIALPTRGCSADSSFLSDDPEVLTYDADDVWSVNGPGVVTVTAKCQGRESSRLVTILPVSEGREDDLIVWSRSDYVVATANRVAILRNLANDDVDWYAQDISSSNRPKVDGDELVFEARMVDPVHMSIETSEGEERRVELERATIFFRARSMSSEPSCVLGGVPTPGSTTCIGLADGGPYYWNGSEDDAANIQAAPLDDGPTSPHGYFVRFAPNSDDTNALDIEITDVLERFVVERQVLTKGARPNVISHIATANPTDRSDRRALVGGLEEVLIMREADLDQPIDETLRLYVSARYAPTGF